MAASSYPGPLLQRLNRLVHAEPYSIIFYGLYWTLVFLLACPVLLFVLHVQMVWGLLRWALFGGCRADDYHRPKRQQRNSENDGDNDNDSKEMAIVITGCDSGIGRELAIVAAQEGFAVFAGCISESSFPMFDFSSPNSKVHPMKMDVTRDEDADAARERVEAWLSNSTDDPPTTATTPGGENKKPRVLHAICNNAGVCGPAGDADWIGVGEYQKVMDVNFFGMVRCCKAFLPIFKRQAVQGAHRGAARILNLTSLAGVAKSLPGMSPYCASKHAAAAFSFSLRQELHGFGIQVCTVCPTFHGTPMVENMHDRSQSFWETLPKELRDQYGEESMEYMTKMADRAHSVTWSVDNIIRELMKGLQRKTVPAEMIIGMDARFILLNLLLPAWFVDLASSAGALPKRAIPRAMKLNTK